MVELLFQSNIKVPAYIIQEFQIGIPFKITATESFRIDNVVQTGLGSLVYCLPTLKLNNLSLLELRSAQTILLPPPSVIGDYVEF